MKRLMALMMTTVMLCGLCAVSTAAVPDGYVISPELKRGVNISKEVTGDAAEDYEDVEFHFELDVSKVKFKDNRWEAFANKEGITYDADRDVLCFSLKAGEEIALELPFGDEYTLAEVGGYDSDEYVYTTINGEFSRDHTFDIDKKDTAAYEVDVINVYEEDGEITEDPKDPFGPGGGEDPDDPKDPGDPDRPGAPEGDDPGSERPGRPGEEDPKGENPGSERPIAPQTGYPVGVLALSIAAAASGAVAVVAGKKAKKD